MRGIGDIIAEAADPALRDAGSAHGLAEVVDGAGGDAVVVGFLDRRGERLLGGAPRGRLLTAAASRMDRSSC